MEKIAIILLGAPGSGKGTQGELMRKRTKYKNYTMSSLIKKEFEKGEKDWVKRYKKDITKGILLGDSDIFELFRENFKLEDRVILDGIPRTLDQSYWLYGFLKEHKYTIKVVFLNCDEDKLLERIVLRSEKEGRKDDDPKVFKERLVLFDKVKEVILEVYKDEIVEINGDQSIDDVEKEVIKKLGF